MKSKSISSILLEVSRKPWNLGIMIHIYQVPKFWTPHNIFERETFIWNQFLLPGGDQSDWSGLAVTLFNPHGPHSKNLILFTTPPTPLHPPLSHSSPRRHHWIFGDSTKEEGVPLGDLHLITGLTDLPSRSFDFSFEIPFKWYSMACFSSIYFFRP